MKRERKRIKIEFLPIKRWYGIAIGILHIPSSEFWKMTYPQFEIALNCHNEFHSGNKNTNKPVTRDEMEDLMTRFPD